MQFKAIKNLAATIAVLVSATAGLSAMDHYGSTSAMDLLATKQARPTWSIQVSDHGDAVGEFQGVKARISRCGKIIDVSGTSECIGVKEKRRTVQLVEIIKILMGVSCQYTPCHVAELIKEFEHCPCPEIKVEPQHCLPVVVKPTCSRPVSPVAPHCGRK